MSNIYDALRAERKGPSKERPCSFCRRFRPEVEKIVTGPGVSICNECIKLCVRRLREDDPSLMNLDFFRNMEIDLSALGIKPRFQVLHFQQRKHHCFYLSPFREPYNTIYKDHVVPVLNGENLTVDRADELFGTQPIVEDIWESINTANLIFADVSQRSGNVLYEVGIAHTVGKPVILMAQDMNDVPFDLRHYRYILYEATSDGMGELEKRLRETVRFLKGKLIEFEA